MKSYSEMTIAELQFERKKLSDRHGDEPVRARFLADALDEVIKLREEIQDRGDEQKFNDR